MAEEKKISKLSDKELGAMLTPFGDRCVVRREAKVTQIGSIVLPEGYVAKQIPDRGTIISVGPGEKNADGKHKTLDMKFGDKVLFCTYAGQIFKLDEEEVLLLRESDLLAKIN